MGTYVASIGSSEGVIGEEYMGMISDKIWRRRVKEK